MVAATEVLDKADKEKEVAAAGAEAAGAPPAPPAAGAVEPRLRAAAMVAHRGLAEIAAAAGRLEDAEVLSCKVRVRVRVCRGCRRGRGWVQA